MTRPLAILITVWAWLHLTFGDPSSFYRTAVPTVWAASIVVALMFEKPGGRK